MGTVIIVAIVIVAAAAAARSLYKERKSGKSSCGCDCGSCGAHCHEKSRGKS